MAIRVLVVDDSAFMRKIITDLIKDVEDIEVVGIARNGLDALEAIPRLKPDIVTLDIEMPKLNGIDTLKIIKKDYDLPVIMLSSLSGRDITIEALEEGALDFIVKPSDLRSNLEDFKMELEIKLKSIGHRSMGKSIIDKKASPTGRGSRTNQKAGPQRSIEAVVIGASTGGPKALTEVIRKVPRELNIPIFIVQHMPKGFTSSFAARLNKEADVKVVEAEDNMLIQKVQLRIVNKNLENI